VSESFISAFQNLPASDELFPKVHFLVPCAEQV